MKFLLVVAAVVAVAVAVPTQRGIITPIAAGPAPVIMPPAVLPHPIAVSPPEFSPVDISPALIDFPLTETGEVPVPAVIAPPPAAPAPSAPLVQIILNINQAESAPVGPNPVIERPQPEPVIDIPVNPVDVIEVAPVPVAPVDVVELAPVPVEPVIIGTPILPSPAINLPEELN